MTDQPERRMMQPNRSTRPGDATLAADMCPRCKGDNTEAFALCEACAEPTALRDRYAAAIASYDHAVGLASDPAPRGHHYGQADAVMAVRAAVEPQETNLPGSRREQLPADVLALIRPRGYLSTACDAARRVDIATIQHPDNAELPAWVEQLHGRCRLNNKFTGEPCNCRCHTPA